MTSDLLLPGWDEKIKAAIGTAPALPFMPPLSQNYLAGRVHMVQDKAGALEMVQAAFESPVSCIGIDTEYRFTEDQPIRLRASKDNWHDIRSTRPFCVALAIVSLGRMLRFVVDVRVTDLLPLVQQVLDLPVPFASHYAKAESVRHLVTGLARTPYPLGHVASGEGVAPGRLPATGTGKTV